MLSLELILMNADLEPSGSDEKIDLRPCLGVPGRDEAPDSNESRELI